MSCTGRRDLYVRNIYYFCGGPESGNRAGAMKRMENARERGFTLIEILIAMTLLGLLMAMLSGGLRLGTRAWEASDTRSAELARLEAVQGFIRRSLTGA